VLNVRNIKPLLLDAFKARVAAEKHCIVAVVEALMEHYAFNWRVVKVRRGKKARPGCQE
jgi:hypothetical protein